MSLTSTSFVMARKRYKPEEIVAKLRQVDVLVSQGQNIVDAIRQIVVSEVTYYRWRQEFGGLKTEQVKCLKVLKLENSRLRKAVSDPTLDKLILQEAARKLLSPAHRRACIEQVRAQLHVSERRALVRRSGSTARRNARSRAVVTTSSVSPPILSSLPGNTAAISCLSQGRELLCQAGWTINDKRERIWQREGLKVPHKQPKRSRLAGRRIVHPAAAGAPQSCLVLRLCRGPHPRWTQVSDV